MESEKPQRPKIENYFLDASLSDMHNLYLNNPGLWKYIQGLDDYCDELENQKNLKEVLTSLQTTVEILEGRRKKFPKSIQEMKFNAGLNLGINLINMDIYSIKQKLEIENKN